MVALEKGLQVNPFDVLRSGRVEEYAEKEKERKEKKEGREERGTSASLSDRRGVFCFIFHFACPK